MPRKKTSKICKNRADKKAREAMLAAVQIYNNPQVTFKAESFITLAVIGWTYLLHAFLEARGIDYRYYRYTGKRRYMIKLNTEHTNIGNLNGALTKRTVL